ncbi:MAG TPA: hypothetical protein VIJ57_13675 [Hanamia sp.]
MVKKPNLFLAQQQQKLFNIGNTNREGKRGTYTALHHLPPKYKRIPRWLIIVPVRNYKSGNKALPK